MANLTLDPDAAQSSTPISSLLRRRSPQPSPTTPGFRVSRRSSVASGTASPSPLTPPSVPALPTLPPMPTNYTFGSPAGLRTMPSSEFRSPRRGDTPGSSNLDELQAHPSSSSSPLVFHKSHARSTSSGSSNSSVSRRALKNSSKPFIAKRKRNAVKRAKRCRPKTTSLAATSTLAAQGSAPTTKASTSINAYTHAPTTSKAPSTTRSSTSSAVATTKAAPPSGGGGGGANLSPNNKFLMAWPNGPTDMGKWKGGKGVAGVYSWSPSDPTQGIYPFFPMCWGFNQKTSFSKIDGSKYKLCFGPNEPNQDGQSDMSPQDGANLWKAVMEPARLGGCKLVSPATTSAPSGLTWMQEFFKLCTDCHIDYVALHWYDVDINAFKAYVTKFWEAFRKPIIISEYACQNFNNGRQCTKDETWALHTAMAQWFQQQDFVAMFAPFGAMREMQGVNADNQLMNNDGTPTALGAYYLYGSYM
ncbi:hypothetical protein FRC06_009612 [Ceratobasidium sp. 370]|nr:hypothetical protein FRC06_009612 [Ceratobasidium sp. 370]